MINLKVYRKKSRKQCSVESNTLENKKHERHIKSCFTSLPIKRIDDGQAHDFLAVVKVF